MRKRSQRDFEISDRVFEASFGNGHYFKEVFVDEMVLGSDVKSTLYALSKGCLLIDIYDYPLSVPEEFHSIFQFLWIKPQECYECFKWFSYQVREHDVYDHSKKQKIYLGVSVRELKDMLAFPMRLQGKVISHHSSEIEILESSETNFKYQVNNSNFIISIIAKEIHRAKECKYVIYDEFKVDKRFSLHNVFNFNGFTIFAGDKRVWLYRETEDKEEFEKMKLQENFTTLFLKNLFSTTRLDIFRIQPSDAEFELVKRECYTFNEFDISHEKLHERIFHDNFEHWSKFLERTSYRIGQNIKYSRPKNLTERDIECWDSKYIRAPEIPVSTHNGSFISEY